MSLTIEGKVWCFGNDIDTDELFAGRFIMVGNEKDAKAYKMSILDGAIISLSTIGRGNNNVPDGFIETALRVLNGYKNNNEEDKNAMSGNIIVARENFGIGSSRQQAAEALRFLGISVCLSETIHRIFFRNFWNLGGVAIDKKGVSANFKTGDTAKIDLNSSLICNVTNNIEMKYNIILPEEFIEMYQTGGLISYHKGISS